MLTSKVLTALLLYNIAWENTEVSNDSELLRQRAIMKNSKNTSNKKGLEKTTQFFFFFYKKMEKKEKGIKGLDHQNATGKKNAFGFPHTWQIRAAFLPIPQASFHVTDLPVAIFLLKICSLHTNICKK